MEKLITFGIPCYNSAEYMGKCIESLLPGGDDIEIIIMDDGVGYDVNEMKKEESVGLDNVRFRLKYMVKGRMNIESSPGNGTKVTIIIPHKEAAL